MPAQLVTVTRTFITTRFGGSLLEIDFDFRFNDNDCSFAFVRATPTASGYTIGGTGPSWVTRVNEVSSSTVQCETPATCKKTITLNVQVRETWNLLVPLVGVFVVRNSRRIINRNLRFATPCLPQCCQ